VAGTAEELDNQLPSALVQFVGAHIELNNTLESAKEQMAAAAKAAKAEARSKATPKTAPVPTAPAGGGDKEAEGSGFQACRAKETGAGTQCQPLRHWTGA
jgi:hypothetical protein